MEQIMSTSQQQGAAAPSQGQQQGQTTPTAQQVAGAATAPKPVFRDWAAI